jgi:hypothetical protein
MQPNPDIISEIDHSAPLYREFFGSLTHQPIADQRQQAPERDKRSDGLAAQHFRRLAQP